MVSASNNSLYAGWNINHDPIGRVAIPQVDIKACIPMALAVLAVSIAAFMPAPMVAITMRIIVPVVVLDMMPMVLLFMLLFIMAVPITGFG